MILFLSVGIYAVCNFDNAFVIFHSLLFPGKDNWIFDSDLDPIIDALPVEFFMSSAGLILLSVITISVSLMIFGFIKAKKGR